MEWIIAAAAVAAIAYLLLRSRTKRSTTKPGGGTLGQPKDGPEREDML